MSDKPFELDKKSLLEEVPMLLKGFAGSFIDKLNKMDLNKDGKADIGQLAPFLFSIMPLLIRLAGNLKINEALQKAKDFVVKSNLFENREEACEILEKLIPLLVQLGKLVGVAK